MKWFKAKFIGQSRITSTFVVISAVFAIYALQGWLNGHFTMWPVLSALGLHVIWLGTAFRHRLKISKTGLEIDPEDEPKECKHDD